MSEWRNLPAGKIARQRREIVRLEPGSEYRTMGVRWYGKGAYDRGVVTTETVKARSLYRARKGDFTFNRIDTDKGAFDVVSAELDGALATNEFPLYEVDKEEMDARFLLFYFQQPEVLRQIGAVRAGSEGRARWKEADFEAWIVPVPPLPVQERIVEAIGAVDSQIAALDRELEAAVRMRDGLLDELTGADNCGTTPLGHLCTAIGSGPSWAAKDESSSPAEGSRTVLKITNTRPDGTIDLSELAYVAGLPDRTKVIGPTTLIMIRTNGNRARIGNVYLPSDELHGAAVSAFQFTLDATDVETRDYLYLVLRSPRIQHKMSESASGSTGLGNLAVRWLKTLEVPWPDVESRKAQIEMVQAVDANIAATRTEVGVLRDVRTALLSGLLDRTIDIQSAELGV